MSSPSQWKSEQARTLATSLQVPIHSLVCRPCRQDVSRVIADHSYVPRWRKEREKVCCISDCNESVFACSRMANSETLRSAMDAAGVECSVNDLPEPTPLCKQHYHMIYNVLQPPQTNCVTCNISLRHCNIRPCPKPEVIEEHLRENTGFEGHVKAQDKVCFTCYKSHLIILQQSRTISRDTDLQQLLTSCRQKILPADSVRSQDDVISSAMANTVVLVGSELVKGGAILLPTVHDSFCEFARALTSIRNPEGVKDVRSLVTSRWILSNLTVNLQHHITYSCRVRKYGTVIYRPHSDLIPSLSQALWELRNIKGNVQYSEADTCTDDQLSTDTCMSESVKVLDTLNLTIHSQINTLLAQDAKKPFEYDELDIDKLIPEMNQTLWKAICLLTRSASERRGTAKVTDPSTSAYHIKRIRCFSLFCNLLQTLAFSWD